MNKRVSVLGLRIHIGLLVVISLALWVRLIAVLVFFGDYIPESDAAHFQQMAINILSGYGPVINDKLLAYRLPVTAYYLAFIYSVFGVSIRAAQIANVILGVVTVWLAYDLVRRIFGIPAALWAGLFAAGYPMLVFYTGHLLSETPTIFLLALALWLIWWARSRSLIWHFILGIVLGLAILTRQVMLPVAGLLVLWVALSPRVPRFDLSRFLGVILTLIAIASTLTPWVVRNYRLTGEFVLLTSQGGTSLWAANNPLADGTGVGGKWLKIPELGALPESERGAAYQHRAIQYILEDPVRFVLLSLRRLTWFWHLGYHGDGLREIAFLLVYLPTLVLALLGGVVAWKRNRWALYLLGVVPLVVSAVSAVFLPVGRYRLPAELIMCMLAGVGVAWLFSRYQTVAGGSAVTESV